MTQRPLPSAIIRRERCSPAVAALFERLSCSQSTGKPLTSKSVPAASPIVFARSIKSTIEHSPFPQDSRARLHEGSGRRSHVAALIGWVEMRILGHRRGGEEAHRG